MAAIEVQQGSPLATAIQSTIQPRIIELGWSPGDDDNALAEYVVMLLVNGKSRDEIVNELATDLLGLAPTDQNVIDFAQWVLDTTATLNAQLNGVEVAPVQPSTQQPTDGQQLESASGDADMGDGSATVPTGPKSMRNGSQKARGGGRMLNQINKNMSGDAALHRVRGANGAGRINSHSNRDAPKGPRSQQVQRGLQAGNAGPITNNMGPQSGNVGFHQPNMMMQGGLLNPAQQMQLLQMMEQQSILMSNLMGGQNGPGGASNGFQNGQGQGHGRSMFDRVERNGLNRKNHRNNRPNKQQNQDQAVNDGSSAMDAESTPSDPANTLCRFNLTCSRSDCEYAHQSPAAPHGVAVDMTDTCNFGAACKNFKCVAKHPSPAKKFAHQAEIQCSFWPNCTKPNCQFKHPAPPCRNGGDCKVEGCKFTHNTTMCKFNPCKNPACTFKHAEGQKGTYGDKVWTAYGGAGGGGPHVSERRFVEDEAGQEELIIPVDQSAEHDLALDSQTKGLTEQTA